MDDRSRLNLSRRGFLTGAAGVAGVAALPWMSGPRAAAAVRSARSVKPASRARPADLPPAIAGATITPATYGVMNAVDAADIFDGYVGTSLALQHEKFYATPDILAETTVDSVLSQLSAAGCTFVIDVEPSKSLTSANQTGLSNWLTMLNNAGIVYRVVLYSESNNTAFATPQEWFAYWSFYAPVIQAAGVLCGYNPGCGTWAKKAITFWPSDPTPDELWMDYYCTGFRDDSRLSQLIALAQTNGVTGAGLAEWGWEASAHPLQPITMPWWNDYCRYILHLIELGHINLGGMYFGSSNKTLVNNVINNSDDPRIAMINEVSTAFTAG
jgi:hypothetical protein